MVEQLTANLLLKCFKLYKYIAQSAVVYNLGYAKKVEKNLAIVGI